MEPPRTSASRVKNGHKRRWWHFLIGVMVGGGLVVALLFIPPVQGWLLKRFISTQPGWQLDFARFFAGPTGVEAEGINFSMPGIEARTEPLRVQIAPTQLLRSRQLRIEKVEAQKVRLVITPEKFAVTSPTPGTPFAGLLPLLQLPLSWAVDHVDLDGQIALNEGGASVAVGDFKIQGGGLEPGQRGEFAYELSFNSTLLPIAPDNHVRSHGTIQITQTGTHGIARIELRGELTPPAYGALRLPTGKIHLIIDTEMSAETYQTELDFGDAGQFAFSGHIDAGAGKLLGEIEWTLRDSLLASLADTPLPALTADGSGEVVLDLESIDFTAALKGRFTGQEWRRYMPELAPVPAFTGDWRAALKRTHDALRLESFALQTQSAAAPTVITLQLDAPVNLLALPATPIATFTLRDLPVDWANPWLESSELALHNATFGGRWSVALDDALTAHLQSLDDARATGIQITGAPVSTVDISFPSSATINAETFSMQTVSLQLGTGARDNLTGEFRLDYAIATEAATISTQLRGSLPTVFGDTATSPTIRLDTQFIQQGDALRLERLKLDLLNPATAAATFSAVLQHPLTLDMNTWWPTDTPTTPTELLQIQFAGLTLDWLGDPVLAGEIAGGASTLSSTPEGKLQFTTTTPWQTRGLRFGNPSDSPLDAALSVQPNALLDAATKQIQAALTLGADLPNLPHSATTFGPLHAELKLNARNEGNTLAIVDAFDFRLTQSAGARELLSLQADYPFIAGQSNSGTAVLSTLAPLKLKLAELPLAWMQPWADGLQLSGTLAPTEFLIASDKTRVQLRPTRPLALSNVSVSREGQKMLHAVDFACYPGLDLTLICKLEPKFELGFEGVARLDDGTVKIAGQPTLDLDVALRFLGDDTKVLPSGIELTSRAKLAAWHQLNWLSQQGLPGNGTLVTRINGDLLGVEPVAFWTRLEGVKTANGDGLVAPLEMVAHGKVDGLKRSVTGDFNVVLDTQPRRSDAAFRATLDLREADLHIDSALTSRYLDVAAAMNLVDAFTANTQPTGTPASKTTALASTENTSLGMPFWSVLRGAFDLDIGTLEFAPYRIDQVTGRLTLEEARAALSNLHGEMFAGTWSGAAQIDYVPNDAQGDHHLTGDFRIKQFQSARVVQTVFPDNDLASLDALINVRAAVNSSGNRLPEMLNRAAVQFEIDGTQGTVRLKVPKQDLIATAAVFGGTILLSPELRALGRLLRKFSEMPVETLHINGARNRNGGITLDEFRFESPQARLLGRGQIVADLETPLMQRPLMLSLDLAAKDETAVILGGMKLLRKETDAAGFRALKTPLVLRGAAGEPDTQPLYDMLARAVSGSKGTWGFLMRKVQAEVLKAQPPAPRQTAAATP